MQRDDSQEGPTPAEDVRYDDAEQLTASTSAAAEGVEPNRSSLPLGRSVPRYLAAALCTTVIMTVADAVQAAFSEAGPRVSVGEFGAAVLFLLAFTLPVTIGVALAFAGLGWLIRATPATESVRRRLTPRAWVVKDPEGFATGIGSVVGLGVLALGGRELFAVLFLEYDIICVLKELLEWLTLRLKLCRFLNNLLLVGIKLLAQLLFGPNIVL